MDLVTVLLSIVITLFLAKVFNNQKQDKNYPPGPKPLPIIGSLHMVNPMSPQKDFMKLSKMYGSVFSIQLGLEKMVVLCGYDTIKDALVNHAEEFYERPEGPFFNRTTNGNGIVFAHGENWKVMRRFTLSTLRDFGMGRKSLENNIKEELVCLIQEFQSHKGNPFDNHIIINAAVANVIVSILLGNRFEYDDPIILKLTHSINENIRTFGSTMVRLYNSYPTLIDFLPGSHQKIFENFKLTQDFIKEVFTKQKNELDINDQRNLIDAFLAKQQEGKPESTAYFHNDNLSVLVDNLFVAGMETTSTTLRWSLLLMMKYPEIQKKVQNEIDRVIGSSQPQTEHRKQMPYTDAVIHEIQRFADIAPLNVPHATAKDVTFRGYNIPKGTTIIPLLTSVLRNTAYFEKADDFYPEHFLDSEGNLKKNEAFIPFSIGKRSCAGENLAKMELFLFFTTLLQNFTFQAPPGVALDLTPALGFTNAPLSHKIRAIPLYAMDLVAVLLSIVIILFLAKVYYDQKKDKNFPPGPKSLPIIGNMHLINPISPQKDFMKLSKTYGSVYSIQMGLDKMVILCGYETIKDALVNHAEEFYERPEGPFLTRTTNGNGIVFAHGENWKVMRRFTLSTLRDFGMGKRSIENKIKEELMYLIQEFRSHKGNSFDNCTIINAAVANIIVSILLGDRFDYDDPTILKLKRSINENVKSFENTMVRLYNSYPKLIGFLPGSHHKVFENFKRTQDFIKEVFINQKKQVDINDQRNLVDAFLAKQQEGKPESTAYFHNDNLTVLVDNLFVAGLETTSTTLRWSLLLMIKYPEIQKKVHDEIDRVIGSAQPKSEHRKLMPYTDAVIHETQRFADIVPMNVPHATAKDVTFRGYNIPKGTMVIPLLTSVLRDTAYFEKADDFYPEHFLDSKGNLKKNEAFIPFSIGKRSCVGENLAKMELFLFFTTLLQNFTFQAPSGVDLDLTPTLGFTNAPLPHKICAIPRT
ncbi:cytochrome P450 2C11-like [Mantella aurantiaca]